MAEKQKYFRKQKTRLIYASKEEDKFGTDEMEAQVDPLVSNIVPIFCQTSNCLRSNTVFDNKKTKTIVSCPQIAYLTQMNGSLRVGSQLPSTTWKYRSLRFVDFQNANQISPNYDQLLHTPLNTYTYFTIASTSSPVVTDVPYPKTNFSTRMPVFKRFITDQNQTVPIFTLQTNSVGRRTRRWCCQFGSSIWP